jgi:hypothetical protein
LPALVDEPLNDIPRAERWVALQPLARRRNRDKLNVTGPGLTELGCPPC